MKTLKAKSKNKKAGDKVPNDNEGQSRRKDRSLEAGDAPDYYGGGFRPAMVPPPPQMNCEY